jgi:hypothetical protein
MGREEKRNERTLVQYATDLAPPGVDDGVCCARNTLVGSQVRENDRDLVDAGEDRIRCRQSGGHTCAGSDIAHARPTNALLRSVIGSATNILIPAGSGGTSPAGSALTEEGGGKTPVSVCSECMSARTMAPATSALSRSPYHAAQRSTTHCKPSKTQTTPGVHSTPLADEMKVRNTAPKRAASAPNAPM